VDLPRTAARRVLDVEVLARREQRLADAATELVVGGDAQLCHRLGVAHASPDGRGE
jgi:hypothetical protein